MWRKRATKPTGTPARPPSRAFPSPYQGTVKGRCRRANRGCLGRDRLLVEQPVKRSVQPRFSFIELWVRPWLRVTRILRRTRREGFLS